MHDSSTFGGGCRRMPCQRGNLYSAGELNDRKQNKIMGDKSPKSTQKKSSQKQVKASTVAQAKKQAAAVKQAAPKKK
jgi:hypothetical protein